VRYCAAGRATTTGTPLAPDDVFRIASITKTFTAVMVMQLVEEGRLSLDSQVGDVLPDLDFAQSVTLRQLLNHTSGLPDFFDDTFRNRAFEDWDRTWTPTEVLDRLRETDGPPVPPTEEVVSYSNTNYLIAGLMVEEVTGRTLAENLQARIIEPLGLTSTALAPAGPEPVTGFAAPLPFGNSEGVSYTSLETGIWAAGAMVSTAPDLVTFARALPDGELVSAESWEQMTVFLQLEDGTGMGLGLGRDEIDGRTVIGHDGLLPGYTSRFLLLPESDEVVVVLTNDINIAAYDVVSTLLSAP
jgi:D-alanyl-D-alanine carboxypeptidase